jgi:fatty acid desaturase
MAVGFALMLGLAFGNIVLMEAWLPLPLELLLSFLQGSCYVSLMFVGHEVGHGVVVSNRTLRSAFVALCTPIYLVSPHLWEYWHNHAHHCQTNVAGLDPDSSLSLQEEEKRAGIFAAIARRLAPGSGHWLSLTYPLVSFTIQGQMALWRYSHRWTYRGFSRTRAFAETFIIALCWLALALAVGTRGTLLLIVIPMVSANFIIMAYVSTNHQLRPLVLTPNIVETTMSVKTIWFLDWIHLHFSHHVEHHLFPGMSHRFYPEVRLLLEKHLAERYIAPAHGKAFLIHYMTPRPYAAGKGFVNPLNGKVVRVDYVEQRLLG